MKTFVRCNLPTTIQYNGSKWIFKKVIIAYLVAAMVAASCSPGTKYCRQSSPNYHPYNSKKFKF